MRLSQKTLSATANKAHNFQEPSLVETLLTLNINMSSAYIVLLHYKFRDFIGQIESGDRIESELQHAPGSSDEWKIALYPEGNEHSDEGFMAAVLLPNERSNRQQPMAKCQFSIKNCKGQSVHEIDFNYDYPVKNDSVANNNFIRRSDILDNADMYLIGGRTLHIDVTIQIIERIRPVYGALIP